tara:strand:+ start:2341 stop:2451 length:111 start_codon:yes stop_codon:yes gene_type:complete
MTEQHAKEFRSKYIIADFEDEGHKTWAEYEEELEKP